VNSSANAAFYYLLDGYDTSGKSLMGRQSAGEGFLKGFVQHSGVDTLYCYAPDARQFGHFRKTVAGIAGQDKPCAFIPFQDYPRLSEVGCLFVPGPAISNDAWVRRSLNSRAYSICGVTHTTATERIMDSFGALLVDPVQSWDAIVCTSSVVKKTLERVIGSYAEYLEERLGVRPDMPVQFPVIPLGVDCGQYSTSKDREYRKTWRDKLEIADEDIAVLYMGRLNFNAKAHPLPMFLSLEEVAKRTGRRVFLLLTGWFDPPATENLWKQDALRYCPSVHAVFLDGRQKEVRREIWSAADIFTSLSDNIQETFGLTPIEAMAAGLPMVVTDWDGYRDTVRHGIDGFRVPTIMPEPGMGEDLAVRFINKVDSYGRYCGAVSQMTCVDIGACIAAFSALVQNTDLRMKMGSAGRERARKVYDWSVVVERYQELWRELAMRRLRDRETAPLKKRKPALPLRIDPFTLFQEYPTDHIRGNTLITLQAGKYQGWVEHITSSGMNNYMTANGNLMLSKDEQKVLVEYLKKHESTTVAEIAKLFPNTKENVISGTIGWMGKNGIISIRGAMHQEEINRPGLRAVPQEQDKVDQVPKNVS
jgi:glycosyltransferase involved in cell wall biosynthesis